MAGEGGDDSEEVTLPSREEPEVQDVPRRRRRKWCCKQTTVLRCIRLIGGLIGLLLIVEPFILIADLKNELDLKTGLVLARILFYGILVLFAELRFRYMLQGWTFLTTWVGRGFLYLFISLDMYSSLHLENDNYGIVNITACIAMLAIGLQSLLVGCASPEMDQQHLNQHYRQDIA